MTEWVRCLYCDLAFRFTGSGTTQRQRGWISSVVALPVGVCPWCQEKETP